MSEPEIDERIVRGRRKPYEDKVKKSDADNLPEYGEDRAVPESAVNLPGQFRAEKQREEKNREEKRGYHDRRRFISLREKHFFDKPE